MDEEARKAIRDAFQELPEGVRCIPAVEVDLQHFEIKFGRIPADFRWFLSHCGGGTIGAEWIDGITELARSHTKYQDERTAPNGWSMQGVFVIGWDGAGNPIGIEKSTGRILVEDHHFGGVHEMAPSLEEFLKRGLLN